jgi:hypothetical protein
MTPAKKKTAKKPAKVAAPSPPPPPVLTPPQKRFWHVVSKRNLIGGTLFAVGLAFALGYLVSDKAHLHEKVALYMSGGLMLFGALLLDFESVKQALGAAVGAARDIRKPDPPAGGA